MLKDAAREAVKKFLDDPTQETYDALDAHEDEIAAHLPLVMDEVDNELIGAFVGCCLTGADDEETAELLEAFTMRFLFDPLTGSDVPSGPPSAPAGTSVGYRPPKHPWTDSDED